MEIFRVALLLLLQLSPTFVHINGEVVPEYMCDTKQTSDVTVKSATAKLTKGCVVGATERHISITFDLDAMYKAAASKTPNNPKTPVAIDVSDAVFLKSNMELKNADRIRDLSTRGPLQFTMIRTNMNGRVSLSFGEEGKTFKLPSNSLISITECKMTISDTRISESFLFAFSGLQLVGESSLDIAYNEITMECEKCNAIVVFNLQRTSPMTISGKSSFTIRNNNITMKGSNNIGSLVQSVWYQDSTSPLTISKNSNYTWLWNRISMDGHNVKEMMQYVWYTASPITISTSCHFLIHSNKMQLITKDYETIVSYVMMLEDMSDKTSTGTISGGSTMIWRDNCVGMGHTKAGKSQAQGQEDPLNKKHMFAGKWSITDKGSELQVDGNHISTTDKYGPNDRGLTQLVWESTKTTDISKEGIMTIRNTKVYSNNAADGATGSLLWSSSLYTSDTSAKQPDMTWSSSPAKDGKGSPIPTLENSNLKDYMCVALPGIPPDVPNPDPSKPEVPNPTNAPKGKSAAAILSITPGVLITSVVFLYLYNW